MKISVAAWTRYKDRLSKIDQRAVDEMTEFLRQIHGWEGHEPQVLAFAYGLSTKYGEAAAAAACEMYDTCARASGRRVPKAEPAPTATYNETAKAVRGTVKNRSESQIPNTVGRLVKQAGADTTLRNVARDGAQFAWVPSGDTCPFCIMLASNGWQYISKNTLKKGHAEHIHANCDCQYAVRFSEQDGVAGYDPNQYREIYDNAEGNTWQEKLRSMQHDNYEANKDRINAQKREIYARNRRLKYGNQAEFESDRGTIIARKIDKYGYNRLFVDDNVTMSEREVRYINNRITAAKELLGITGTCDANIIITDLRGDLASYNPRTNTLFVDKRLITDADVKRLQSRFACSDDTRSTIVHELLHWEDANRYRRDIGAIEECSPTSAYSIYQNNVARKWFTDNGIDMNTIHELRKISFYAFKMALENNLEEAYTELRTYMLLKGK